MVGATAAGDVGSAPRNTKTILKVSKLKKSVCREDITVLTTARSRRQLYVAGEDSKKNQHS